MNPSTESTRPYTLEFCQQRPGMVAEPLQCFIIGLLPILATYRIDVCASGRLMNALTWSTCLMYGHKHHFIRFIPSSVLLFCRHPLFSTCFLSLSLHTHTDRQGRFDSAGRVKSYFLLCYTFQRKVQSLLLRRRRLRGDFTSKPVEAAFFQTCAVGV